MSGIMKLLKNYPFTICGMLGLFLLLIVYIVGFPHDSGGQVIAINEVSQLLTIPYQLWKELFFIVSGGESDYWHDIVAVYAHILVCVGADYVLHKIRLCGEKQHS